MQSEWIDINLPVLSIPFLDKGKRVLEKVSNVDETGALVATRENLGPKDGSVLYLRESVRSRRIIR